MSDRVTVKDKKSFLVVVSVCVSRLRQSARVCLKEPWSDECSSITGNASGHTGCCKHGRDSFRPFFTTAKEGRKKRKKEMGGERCRRGECRGERVIMEAGIIIGVTKERGDPRKRGGAREMIKERWRTKK